MVPLARGVGFGQMIGMFKPLLEILTKYSILS